MVIFLTSVLILSSIAMVALLWTKHWELTTGRVLFGSVRPRIGEVSHKALVVIEQHAPAFIRSRAAAFVGWLRTGARVAVARLWVATEQALERALHSLRNAMSHTHHEANVRGSASTFLREVAEHKRRLMRRRQKEEMKARQELMGEE